MKNGSIWGCDVCQNACPYTKNAKYTPIKYFIDSAISCLDLATLRSMSEEEFNSRPFAWRGPDTIKRNVILWEDYKEKCEAEKKARLEAEAAEAETAKTELQAEILKDEESKAAEENEAAQQ